MTKLSVNINKVATLRNARGGNNPDVVKAAQDCERFGAQGITVHPRPDERHIRYNDVLALHEVVTTEFNIEGYPDDRFMELVRRVKPAQATLVPDAPDAITSNAGWDTVRHQSLLTGIVQELNSHGIRTSIFVTRTKKWWKAPPKSARTGLNCTRSLMRTNTHVTATKAVAPYVRAAQVAAELNLGLNAGHGLDLNNLRFLKGQIPHLLEVSIGHALICDALYYGLENTIQMYLRELE